MRFDSRSGSGRRSVMAPYGIAGALLRGVPREGLLLPLAMPMPLTSSESAMAVVVML